MSASPRFSAALLAVAQREVANFASSTPGVLRAILTTSDGFEVASFQTEKDKSAKIAAISSSLQALADAMAKEAGFIAARDVIIQSDKGMVLVKSVPDTSPALTLAAFAGSSAVLGHMLWAARTCCYAITRAVHA